MQCANGFASTLTWLPKSLLAVFKLILAQGWVWSESAAGTHAFLKPFAKCRFPTASSNAALGGEVFRGYTSGNYATQVGPEMFVKH